MRTTRVRPDIAEMIANQKARSTTPQGFTDGETQDDFTQLVYSRRTAL